MKRYWPLLILFLTLSVQRSSAQAILSMSPVYQLSNDTLPANTFDSVHVWVKNTGLSTYTGNYYLPMVVDSSGPTAPLHGIDTLYSFVPVTIFPGDSVEQIYGTLFDIDTANRFKYDINVIVIWPIVVSGGATVGDSLIFIEVIMGTLGTPEIDLNELIAAYPNPVSHDLNLRIDAQTAIEEVRIFDAQGRLLEIHKKPSKMRTDDWKKGIYFLKVSTSDHRNCTIRVIKQ